MLSNKKYWISRYSEMKGFNVVGHRSWSYEQYIEETKKFFKYIEKHIPFDKDECKSNNLSSVLDFGCGIGRCIPFLSKFFNIYFGVDIVEEIIIRNRKKFKNKNDYNCQLTFETIRPDGVIPVNTTFDLIFSNVVLQHVVDDNLLRFYVQQFRTLCKNNGKIMIIENIDQKPKKYVDVSKYIKFRSFNDYRSLFNPYFDLKLVDKFISSKEEHAVMIGEVK